MVNLARRALGFLAVVSSYSYRGVLIEDEELSSRETLVEGGGLYEGSRRYSDPARFP